MSDPATAVETTSRSVAILGADALLVALPSTPTQLANACFAGGFAEVFPATWGDELIAAGCLEQLESRTGPAIFCACPLVAEQLRGATELRRFIVPLISPPVAVARYLRALFPGDELTITYVGDCPGADDESIDERLSPHELLENLARRGIMPATQRPDLGMHAAHDRRRFYSIPGGVPSPQWLGAQWPKRTLVDVHAGDALASLANQTMSRGNTLIDFAPHLGLRVRGRRRRQQRTGRAYGGRRARAAARAERDRRRRGARRSVARLAQRQASHRRHVERLPRGASRCARDASRRRHGPDRAARIAHGAASRIAAKGVPAACVHGRATERAPRSQRPRSHGHDDGAQARGAPTLRCATIVRVHRSHRRPLGRRWRETRRDHRRAPERVGHASRVVRGDDRAAQCCGRALRPRDRGPLASRRSHAREQCARRRAYERAYRARHGARWRTLDRGASRNGSHRRRRTDCRSARHDADRAPAAHDGLRARRYCRARRQRGAARGRRRRRSTAIELAAPLADAAARRAARDDGGEAHVAASRKTTALRCRARAHGAAAARRSLRRSRASRRSRRRNRRRS